MKISQIIQETTTAGSIAPTEHGFVKMQTRNPSVYGGNKVGNLLKGKKTNKAFANSLNEAAMKDLAYDLQNMKSAEFQKKYGKSREDMKAAMSKQPQKSASAVNETDLSEQDLIVVPGQGRKVKTGFVPHDKDRTDHEVEMAVSDLFSAGKNAEKIYNMVRSVSEDEGLEGWVQEKIIKANDYLNTVREYLEGKELQGTAESLGTTGAMTNGEMGESKDRVDSLVTDALKIMRGSDYQVGALKAIKTVLGDREYNSRRGFYNFYVRQLMDMYDQEGLAEGKLDEISTQSLGNYVKSAAGDMANRKGDTQFQKGARVATSAFNSKLPAGRFEKDSKIEKRQVGIDRAVDKITGKK